MKAKVLASLTLVIHSIYTPFSISVTNNVRKVHVMMQKFWKLRKDMIKGVNYTNQSSLSAVNLFKFAAKSVPLEKSWYPYDYFWLKLRNVKVWHLTWIQIDLDGQMHLILDRGRIR